jgi:hypothetical protein
MILAISGFVLFLMSFFGPWGSIEVSTETSADLPQDVLDQVNQSQDLGSFSLWSGYGILPKLGVLVALLLAAFIVVRAVGAMDSVDLPVAPGMIYLGGAGFVVLMMLIALLFGPEGSNEASFSFGGVTSKSELQRGLFLYIGVVLSIVMAIGAYMHFQEGEPAAAAPPAGPPPGGPPPPPGT